jgi:hypothetical protein
MALHAWGLPQMRRPCWAAFALARLTLRAPLTAMASRLQCSSEMLHACYILITQGLFHVALLTTLAQISQCCAGQYMHYLTKWAFALNRMALVTQSAHYNELAIQLIKGEASPYQVEQSRTCLPRMGLWFAERPPLVHSWNLANMHSCATMSSLISGETYSCAPALRAPCHGPVSATHRLVQDSTDVCLVECRLTIYAPSSQMARMVVADDASHFCSMCRKMSVDLSHPAVPSQGNLDPFDCYVTYRLLDAGPKGGRPGSAGILLLGYGWHGVQPQTCWHCRVWRSTPEPEGRDSRHGGDCQGLPWTSW